MNNSIYMKIRGNILHTYLFSSLGNVPMLPGRIGRSRGILFIDGASRNSKWIVLTAIFLFIQGLPTSCLNASQALGGVIWARQRFDLSLQTVRSRAVMMYRLAGKITQKLFIWFEFTDHRENWLETLKGSHKVVGISQTLFESLLLTTIFVLWIKCHYNMVLGTINQHWLKWWLIMTSL